MIMENTFQHPEWKRLFSVVSERMITAPAKRLYTYSELAEISGIDIRSSRGRRQFELFNQECRKVLNVHWENAWNTGYRIVEAAEHSACAVKRTKQAGKKIKKGKQIADATPLDKLTQEQMSTNLILRGMLATLVEHMKEQNASMKKIAHAMEAPKMVEHKTIKDTLALFKK
jgi:hypothetical protein